MAVGNLLSLHAVTPRVFDACVIAFESGFRMIAQICEYFPGVVKDERRTRALMRRLLRAMGAEGVRVMSPHGSADPDFSHHSNNFCGEETLRYVDTQKLVFVDLAAVQHAAALRLGAPARPERTAELERATIASAVLADFGPASAQTCATALAAGARWYFGLGNATIIDLERYLYAAGFSRFTFVREEAALRAQSADVRVRA